MNIREIKKTVGIVKSHLFKNSNSYSIGMLKSHFRGSGLQFKEHRTYAMGDDVRFIDWKIYAKTNAPYIKTFEEERNVEIVVVIDASATMLMGHNGVSKLQAALDVCTLLYLLARETGDFVHTVVMAENPILIPKNSGDAGIANLISALEKHQIIDQHGKINLEYVAQTRQSSAIEKAASIMNHLSKRKEVVLLSDFNDFLDAELLKKIFFRRNVHCFQIISPLDEKDDFPYLIQTKDPHNSRMGAVNFKGDQDLNNYFGKKVKTLRVHERYLEEFVKEML